MIENYFQKNRFFYIIPICIVASIVLGSIQMHFTKKEMLKEFEGMKFIIESDSHFEATLFYTYDQKFDGSQKLNNQNTASDTLLFNFPTSERLVKKFRLDFGNDPKINSVKIKELHFLFEDKTVVFDEKEVFNSLYKNFSDVSLDKNKRIIHFNKKAKPFDPYIIFLPLAELSMQKSAYPVALLLPFLIFILSLFISRVRHYKLQVLDVLVLLFIMSIPLKIAWTTFTALLLGLYALICLLRRQKIDLKHPAFYAFIGMLGFLALFGRPTNFTAIEKQMSFLLFALISAGDVIPRIKVYKYFTLSFLVFNAIMAASGISFLIWFSDFYGLGISDYFNGIKNYSINVRKWFYYDHAAFLSFFGLIGLLFIHKLYHRKEVKLRVLILYHIILVAFIILAGARICLLIYSVYLINMLVKTNYKKRIIGNTLLFVIFSFVLTSYIPKIDLNRHQLWAVSWEAIKEKPVFGYGLDKSNTILHDMKFVGKAGFSAPLDLNHSHNQYITFLLELGVVGFTFFIIGLIYFLVKSKLYKNNIVVLFLFGLAYLCLTESVLETSKPLYVLCFIFLVISNLQSKSITQKSLG